MFCLSQNKSCLGVLQLYLLSSVASLHVSWQWGGLRASWLGAEPHTQWSHRGGLWSGAESGVGGGWELIGGNEQRLCGLSECSSEQSVAALPAHLRVWQLCAAPPALPHLQGLCSWVLCADTGTSCRSVTPHWYTEHHLIYNMQHLSYVCWRIPTAPDSIWMEWFYI